MFSGKYSTCELPAVRWAKVFRRVAITDSTRSRVAPRSSILYTMACSSWVSSSGANKTIVSFSLRRATADFMRASGTDDIVVVCAGAEHAIVYFPGSRPLNLSTPEASVAPLTEAGPSSSMLALGMPAPLTTFITRTSSWIARTVTTADSPTFRVTPPSAYSIAFGIRFSPESSYALTIGPIRGVLPTRHFLPALPQRSRPARGRAMHRPRRAECLCACCAEYPGGSVLPSRLFSEDDDGLRRYLGGSAPPSRLSGPAPASLALR